MNTGVQRSSAAPPAARTANASPSGPSPETSSARGRIQYSSRWRTTSRTYAERRRRPPRPGAQGRARHGIPWRALPPRPRAVPANGGPRRRRRSESRLAHETGLFPVLEAEHGEVVGVSKIRRPLPVEQRATAATALRTPSSVTRLARAWSTGCRRSPIATSAATACWRFVMEKPFAITLDVGSTERTRRAAGGPSGPCTSIVCRPATTAARPVRASTVALRGRSGQGRLRAPGSRSWRTTRSPP